MKTFKQYCILFIALFISMNVSAANLSFLGSDFEILYACSSHSTIHTIKVRGGTLPYSYSWQNSSNVTFTSDSSFIFSSKIAGVDTMICTVIDANGLSIKKKIRLYSGIETIATLTNFPTEIELPLPKDTTYKKKYTFQVSPLGSHVVG